MLSDRDGYGRAIEEYLNGRSGSEVIERDDGWIEVSRGAEGYCAEFEDWPERQREASGRAHGQILDVGCGAGRVALHFQKLGHRVVGIDISPRAVSVCHRRGLKDVHLLPVSRVSSRLGVFDTVVLFGGNFGLMEDPQKARRRLRQFYRMTSRDAVVLAESRNPYVSVSPVHRAYHRRNRSRGRMPGQLRLRVRSGIAKTPWFDWLIVSPAEMKKIVSGTGWQVKEVIPPEGPAYVAVLRKEVVCRT